MAADDMFNLCARLCDKLQDKQKRDDKGQDSNDETDNKVGKEGRVIKLRPLDMEDFREAKNQVNSLRIIYHPLYGCLVISGIDSCHLYGYM